MYCVKIQTTAKQNPNEKRRTQTAKKREYTEARQKANKTYDEKTYKNYLFRLRLDDDKEIIQSIEKAKKENIKLREWLKEIFEGQK